MEKFFGEVAKKHELMTISNETYSEQNFVSITEIHAEKYIYQK